VWFTQTMSINRAREGLVAVRGAMPASTFAAFLATITLGLLVIARLLVIVVEMAGHGSIVLLPIIAGLLPHVVALHFMAALLLRARWRWSRGLVTVLGVWALATDLAVLEPNSVVDAAVAILAIVAVWLPSARRYQRAGRPLPLRSDVQASSPRR